MAKSMMCGPQSHVWPWPAGRTPGPLGWNDQSDPSMCAMLGDSPGPLGLVDWADPTLPGLSAWLRGGAGGMCRTADGKPVVMVQADPNAAKMAASTLPTELGWHQIKADMVLHEALIQHLYLDSVNKVTVGVGNMLPSLSAAQALGFVLRSDTSKAATAEQVKADWDKVNAEAGKNMRATAFARLTLLDLPEDVCWSLLQKRINEEFLPGLKKIFDAWATIPTPAKRALLDMVYNLGVSGLKKFKTLIGHVQAAEWDKAAAACHRSGIPDDRNDWAAARFREAVPAKVGG